MDNKMLNQKWIRSYEEDTDNEIVYRTVGFSFPLRRGGRESLELHANKTLTRKKSGADDRYVSSEGEWKNENNLIEIDGSKHEIVSVTSSKLVLKK